MQRAGSHGHRRLLHSCRSRVIDLLLARSRQLSVMIILLCRRVLDVVAAWIIIVHGLRLDLDAADL